MKRLIFAAVFAAVGASVAGTTVYRLELTDEKPYIVGQDGARREVVLVDPCEYAIMTGQVSAVWRTMNSTREGRVKLHGKCIATAIDDELKERRETYADGYIWREPMEKMTRQIVRRIKSGDPTKQNRPRERPRNFSKLQWEMRQKLDAAKSGKVKEVTVVHDGATGKDEVVK